jgi:hypothetical protein
MKLQYYTAIILIMKQSAINKSFLICLFCFCSLAIHAQYYYKDIISNKEIQKENQKIKTANIHQIKIKSYEPGGETTEDFFCEKKYSKDYRSVQLTTKTPETGASTMISKYDTCGYLLETYDSSELVVTQNKMLYDSLSRLTKIVSVSKSHDEDFISEIIEEHLYTYDEGTNPKSLVIIKNQKDTNLILFYLDENNRLSIEKDTKTAFKYYYYYDQSGRLTDIVHSNAYTQQPIADYIFDYQADGELAGMTNAVGNKNNTLIWRYDYENGLRIKERAFNADKKFLGKVEYEYIKQ